MKLGIVLIGASAASSSSGPSRAPHRSSGATTLLLVGFLFAATSGSALLAARSRPALEALFGASGTVVATSIGRSPRRMALTSAVVAVGLLLHMFTATVNRSVEQTAVNSLAEEWDSDLVVSPVVMVTGHLVAAVDGSVAERIKALPGVEDVVSLRTMRQSFGGTQVAVKAQSGVYFVDRRYGNKPYTEGDPDTAGPAVANAGAAIVSHNFAFHFAVGPGDEITLDTPAGKAVLPVAGVVIEHVTTSARSSLASIRTGSSGRTRWRTGSTST